MINKIIGGFLGFVWDLVGGFTQPLNDFLINNVPNLDSYLSQTTTFLNSLNNYINWVLYLVPRPFTSTMLYLFIITASASLIGVVGFYILGLMIDFVKRINIFTGK